MVMMKRVEAATSEDGKEKAPRRDRHLHPVLRLHVLSSCLGAQQRSVTMAWGARSSKSSGEEFAAKLRGGLKSLFVLPFRPFGE